MNSYEAKQDARRARLERACHSASNASTAAFRAAHEATSGIPFGQPILVDHSSARRHRAALERSDKAMRRAIDSQKAAEELARRAAAVGTGGISSDDPDAIAKLAEKRTDLEVRRDHMKQANAFYKANGTLDGCPVPADVIANGQATLTFQAYYNKPFPPYAIAGIGARIRDAARRANTIEAVAAMPASVETVGTATITADPDDHRVVMTFHDRLSPEDYKRVRTYGFVWSPTRHAFVRKLSNGALAAARTVAARIAAARTTEPSK